eukprot:TRINITY_DN12979_c0_g1_i1.p1 TRINITY_DN12979_c0_g1~~TRINITY_DN12979_c0_g1_i1.p1  ORF type:complete len:623 (+),score=115.64 TRINITY_DN12979_c0_g1_i1:29-1897(+)
METFVLPLTELEVLESSDDVVPHLGEVLKSSESSLRGGSAVLSLTTDGLQFLNGYIKGALRRTGTPEHAEAVSFSDFFAALKLLRVVGGEARELNMHLFPGVEEVELVRCKLSTTLRADGIQRVRLVASRLLPTEGAELLFPRAHSWVVDNCVLDDVLPFIGPPAVLGLQNSLLEAEDLLAADSGESSTQSVNSRGTALPDFRSLTALDISANRLSSLPVLRGFERLISLGLAKNHLRSFSAVAPLGHLTRVDLSNNSIASCTEFASLESCRQLQWLSLTNNLVSNTSGLPACTALQYLDLGFNAIQNWSEVAKLQTLSQLQELYLRGNSIAANATYRVIVLGFFQPRITDDVNPFRLDDTPASKAEAKRVQKEFQTSPASPTSAPSATRAAPEAAEAPPPAEGAEYATAAQASDAPGSTQLSGKRGRGKKKAGDEAEDTRGRPADASVQCELAQPPPAEEYELKKQLVLDWLRMVTAPYGSVSIENLHESLADGLALCAVVHAIDGSLVDFHNLATTEGNARDPRLATLAFEAVEKALGLPAPKQWESGLHDLEREALLVDYLMQLAIFYAQRQTAKQMQQTTRVKRLKGEMQRYRTQRQKDRRALGELQDSKNMLLGQQD